MPTVTMTAQWVERIKLPEVEREEWFDTKVSGLGLRVSNKGKKTWVVLYRVAGDTKKRRTTLGTFPQLTLADAREKAQAVVLDASKGEDAGQIKQDGKKAPTFKEVAYDYIERYAKSNKRSWKADLRALEKDVIPHWGHRKAKDISRRDAIALLDGIEDRGAPIQANRTLALVRKLFNWAVSRDIVENNPCLQVKPVAKERQRDRVLSEDEIRAVWGAFGKLDTIMETMFKLRLITAQRGQEVETMRWKDVDFANAWWTIPAEYAKNGLSHRVPLSAPAMELLEGLNTKTGEWVFPSPKRKGQHVANIQKAAQRVQETSGVDFVMHDLRRTAASYMTSMGISRLVVSKILNHVEIGVTRVYDRHSYDAEKRQALDSWASRLKDIVSRGGNK